MSRLIRSLQALAFRHLFPSFPLFPSLHSSHCLSAVPLLLLIIILSLSLSLPPPRHDAQPGGSALMHRGTFCSSESQRQQGLRSDRTATSLGISAHTGAAQHQGRLRGEDRGDVVGGVRREAGLCR